jgi:hypothetical protein
MNEKLWIISQDGVEDMSIRFCETNIVTLEWMAWFSQRQRKHNCYEIMPNLDNDKNGQYYEES